ncbi:hypothetical protein LMG33818_000133 [Halomonadaceae bacterium LMG 33818]|uniref:hypothetical protein n=1 Tax=Cernens ardua TaxID=3402176 RepID=UPI003EDB98D0
MPEPSMKKDTEYRIVPADDELLAYPRPGVRPVVKAISWPSLLLSLIALIAVATLAFFYWQDRQTLMAGAEQSAQQSHEQQLDHQRIQQLQQQLQALSNDMQHTQQIVSSIPVIDPQQLSGLDIQVQALNVAVQRLSQQANVSGVQPQDQHSTQQSLLAIDQTQSALGQRMGAIETRLDALSATLGILQHENNQSANDTSGTE